MEFNYGGLKTNMASKSNKIKQKNSLSPKDYKSMSKDDLRQELRKRGIKISGKKSDLVKRLEKFDRQKMAESIEVSVKSRKSYENLTSNGGLENSCTLQHDATNALSSQTKQWIARKKERKSLVIWKRPIITFQYFLKELLIVSYEFGTKVLMYYQLVCLFLLLTGIGIAFYCVEGPHQKYVELIETKLLWYAYWVGLGVLSSVGLGTGLHTFVLYLGPHIAAVTLAAYECNSVNFPQPPYPDEIICPEEESNTIITVLKIMSKVRLEAFMWGAGTALGELPPYFMAKAARLSGEDHEDEELKEFEELLQEKKNNPEEQSFIDKAKLAVEKIVERVGFLGILACASIPNPVFDLAGITCGHFLVPFWTFFGATLIGKAVIKMHIQKLFVIIAFNENQVHKIVNYTRYIPYVGNFLHAPLQEFLAKQKAKLHRKVGVPVSSESSWISVLFEKLVLVMVAYFVLSIVNSMAQSHHKRLQKRNRAGSKVAID